MVAKKKNEIEKEINLSDYVTEIQERKAFFIRDLAVKEFIKKLLTPNNISKGFVEVSTIKYYAGDKLC